MGGGAKIGLSVSSASALVAVFVVFKVVVLLPFMWMDDLGGVVPLFLADDDDDDSLGTGESGVSGWIGSPCLRR